MSIKMFLKKILRTISPSYRKLCAVQEEQANVRDCINTFYSDTVRALDAATNQCWSIRHQMLQLKQQVAAMTKLNKDIYNLSMSMNTGIMTTMSKNQTRLQEMLWFAIQNNTNSLGDAQKQFWQNYPMEIGGDLRMVQTANMYVLNELKKICDENGLPVWLHGGTLIGAVRGNKCIPWDDDVDVAMTRADLERLCEILKDSEDYFIDYLYHDEGVNFSRAYQFKLKNGELPNYIDIFIFDKCEVGEEKKACEEMLLKVRSSRTDMLRKYLKKQVVAIDVGYNHFGPLDEESKQYADSLISDGLSSLGDVYQGNALYYSIENYPFPYPVLRAEDMYPLKMVKFENMEFAIPNDAEKYLHGYGDIWQMPADMGRHPHLYYYKPFYEQIEKFLDEKNYTLD